MTDSDDPRVDPICAPLDRPGATAGPLAGSTFAVKDLFDVAGRSTGAGNPTFAERRPPATSDATAVAALSAAGSHLVGMTITDELAYSLSGTNVHHGTPSNPAAPGRVPGGSSAGSASAVAGGRCDLALGTDTGGSVRVPASYCGTWGMRPTHGRVDSTGLVPLAPSFDTVGWFARDPALLGAAGQALLGTAPQGVPEPSELVLCDDLVALADADAHDSIRAAAASIAAAAGLELRTTRFADPTLLDAWLGAFRVIQGAEAWAVHGDFLATDPPMGPGVRARFDQGGRVTVGEVAKAVAVREHARRHLEAATSGGSILVWPSAATAAPPPDVAPEAKDDLRRRTLLLTTPAGLAGAPAISAPLAASDGCPLGVCLVGAPWSDERLLDLVSPLTPQEER